MALLSIGHNEVAICTSEKVLVYPKSGEKRYVLEQPLMKVQNSEVQNISLSSENKGEIANPEGKRITTCCFCNCGNYFASCNDEKELNLWRTNDWTWVNWRVVPRKCQRLKFTKDCSCFLVGDKSGDIYKFLTLSPDESGQLLLGHLSLLLDLCLTIDDTFVITCDRDEKIRVSCYPNSYNIQAYCLGHTEFVTTLVLLKDHVLTSGSGDGTIRFWNYKIGSEIGCINCNSLFKGECESVIVEKLTAESNMMAVLFFGLQSALVFEIGWKNEIYDSKLIQRLCFSSILWDIGFDTSGVWFLLPEEANPLQIYSKHEDSSLYVPSKKFDSLQGLVAKDWTFLKESIPVKSLIPSLFKQWYDNMTPYVERKQKRIAKKLKKSECVSSTDMAE